MLIKKAVIDKCRECGSVKKYISQDVFGCDNCKKPIEFETHGKHHHDHLEVVIFSHSNDDSKHMQLCSWRCVFAKLRTLKTDYFITLPFLTYERDVMPGQRPADFFKFIKKR